MSVPAALIQPYVVEFVEEHKEFDRRERLLSPGLTTLAIKTALHFDVIERVYSGRKISVQFDTADRILCAVGAVQAWYDEPLLSIYREHSAMEVDPPKNRCHRRGCSNVVPPRAFPGGRPRKYCCLSCRNRDYLRKRRPRVGRYSNLMDKCVHGHDWSPENTYVTPDGKHRLCRQCMRDNAKAQRQKQRKRKAA